MCVGYIIGVKNEECSIRWKKRIVAIKSCIIVNIMPLYRRIVIHLEYLFHG